MTESRNSDDSAEAQRKDAAAKMVLAKEAILKLATEDSPFEDLRDISLSVKEGDTLALESLAGGLTNYSFKVTTQKTKIFAKICFEFALWNPDKSIKYDLSRVENEFQMIKDVSSYEPRPVVMPYHCVDIVDEEGNKMKMLVTAWAPTDEQFANQFIDGDVDSRILDSLAQFLGKVICTPVKDPSFNEDCRPCMQSLFPALKMLAASKLEESTDRALECAQQMGAEKINKMVDNLEATYMQQLVLCHGDPNVFNILVEPKPAIETLEHFGPNGNMVMVDFEMAFVGPHGKDTGWFLGFPVSAILAHAAHGHREQVANKLFGQVEAFLESFEDILRYHGKDEEFIHKTYVGSLQWVAIMHIFYYYMRFHMNHLPLDDVPQDDQAKVFGSIGYVGLKMGELLLSGDGRLETMSRSEIKAFFNKTISDEILELSTATAKRRSRPPRLSVLRTSGTRISDAGELELLAQRLTEQLGGEHLDGVSE
ncbi:MAG: hypothetical protein SGILL_009810 [Bacillariaceae sp.]